MKYLVIKGTNSQELTTKVNKLLRKGYHLAGGIAIEQTYEINYFQAVYLPGHIQETREVRDHSREIRTI